MSLLYTIIIPHYNQPALLKRLLSTIPFRKDIQIIVVDDCSPSSTQIELLTIQKEYPSIELYSTVVNGGAGKARNIGLHKARGRYIIFADADDFFSSNFNTVLDKYSNSSYDIIYFNIKSEFLGNESLRVQKYQSNFYLLENNLELAQKNIRYLFLSPWAKIILRQFLFDHNILFQETPIHNDAMFSATVALNAKKISYDSTILYVLTEQTNSVSKIINTSNISIRYGIFNTINKLYRDNHIDIFFSFEYTALRELWQRLSFIDFFNLIKSIHPNLFGIKAVFKHVFGYNKIRQ